MSTASASTSRISTPAVSLPIPASQNHNQNQSFVPTSGRSRSRSQIEDHGTPHDQPLHLGRATPSISIVETTPMSAFSFSPSGGAASPNVKMEMDVEEGPGGFGGLHVARGRSASLAGTMKTKRSPSVGGVGPVGLAQVPSQASVVSEATSVSTSVHANGEGAVKAEGGQGEGGERKAVKVTVSPEMYAEEARRRGKAKGRTEEEVEAMAGVAYRYATALASDHHHVLNPDTETPFEDAHDVVKRLLPYHVFLQPRRDMEILLERPLSELRGYTAFRVEGGKGKRKATEEELVREEIRETRFALDCWRRKTDLEKRFRKARIAEGKRVVPDTQAYALAKAMLETEKQQLAAMQAEYRASKSELDRVEKEKRAVAAAAQAQASSSATYSTSHVGSTGRAQSTAPATPTSATRPSYGYSYQYSSYAPSPPVSTSTSTTSVPPSQPSTSQTSTSPATSTSTAASSLTSLPSQPIPVLLPVSSLTSLSSLGIVPIHPAHAEQQPGPVAAILRGTTQTPNGTMVRLEINVAALGVAQASGLAVLLSALTSRGVGGSGASNTSTNAVSSTGAAQAREEAPPPG